MVSFENIRILTGCAGHGKLWHASDVFRSMGKCTLILVLVQKKMVTWLPMFSGHFSMSQDHHLAFGASVGLIIFGGHLAVSWSFMGSSSSQLGLHKFTPPTSWISNGHIKGLDIEKRPVQDHPQHQVISSEATT